MGSPERVHQLSLFDVGQRPRSVSVDNARMTVAEMTHRDDAETSRLAAERMVKSGKLRENQAKVLAALVADPGSTYAELAKIAGLPEPEPARRLPELVRLNLAFAPVDEKGKRVSRVCHVRGTECGLWWPTALGMAAVEDTP